MKKYVTYLLILLVSFLFLSVLSTSAALNIEKGMIYAPNSFCTLKARIVSINGQNISFKIIDIIGLSQKFYQDFPYEKSISDKDCKKYYSSNNVTQASTSQKNLTGIKSGDTVIIDIRTTGDEWGTNYVIDNIEQDSLAKIDFTGIKSEAIYLAVILALLLVILYLVFNKSRKKII
ncbi:hypothetical protein A3B87_02335 [Candidatus Kuenenbacteria bacterium RIFCSPHIGHO2_02_FULL_39_13]|uniref:Uncharacterized protein n=1 Tax=Candidatus Kuenenbacteria bacterium RIFCSPHIGHO2_02_FULL_39_13 TaxID=1798561 RepID=A0A1F6FP59_9BACT|nr:MAG: hypothetical protein A3B87_02335 [Candidatus Kuenenbacteria bacterium RIFCSPHIGHO2_02_FULL_39_13]